MLESVRDTFDSDSESRLERHPGIHIHIIIREIIVTIPVARWRAIVLECVVISQRPDYTRIFYFIKCRSVAFLKNTDCRLLHKLVQIVPIVQIIFQILDEFDLERCVLLVLSYTPCIDMGRDRITRQHGKR